MATAWANPITLLVLLVMALAAALTNGAVGYGFSTLFTPVAVLFISNKVLNPALILVELAVNVSLLYRERAVIPLTWRRSLPVIAGLAPGVVVGTVALTYLSALNVRIVLYAMLLPFTLLQILGLRRPVRKEKTWSPVLGSGIGFLYALTTISGPPLAAFWNNQNMGKNEFRCTVAQIRVAEASITAVTYLGVTLLYPQQALFTAQSLSLVPVLAVPVAIGVPVGVLVFRSLSKARFLRIVAAVDSGLITFGLLAAISSEKWINSQAQYLLFTLIVATLAVLVYRVIRNVPANALQAGPTTPDARGLAGVAERGGGESGERGFVVWLEGLPSSGKSTVAQALAEDLRAAGWRAEVLDGRETRRLIPTPANHTRSDREDRAARVSGQAHLLARNGAAVLVPMTTPTESARRAARAQGGPRFVEVWLRCPLEVCKQRDSKGLYQRAARGKLRSMVGINDPFEEPRRPDLTVDTSQGSPDDSVQTIVDHLASSGILSRPKNG
jgi:uncharacterized protein